MTPKMTMIPFLAEFHADLLAGQKTMTSRSKRYGQMGDRFTLAGATFELLTVEKLRLGEVASNYFKEEGFQDPAGFIAIWNKIHPRKTFWSETPVWVHRFRRIHPDTGEAWVP